MQNIKSGFLDAEHFICYLQIQVQYYRMYFTWDGTETVDAAAERGRWDRGSCKTG